MQGSEYLKLVLRYENLGGQGGKGGRGMGVDGGTGGRVSRVVLLERIQFLLFCFVSGAPRFMGPKRNKQPLFGLLCLGL